MKKKKVIIGIGVILIAAAAGVGVKYAKDNGYISTGSTTEDSVYVDSVEKILNPSVGGITQRYSGVIEPQKTWSIEASSEQKIAEIYVEEGDQVKVGQDLFTYDTTEAEESLVEAEIELDRLESDIETSKTQIETMKKELEKITEQDERLEYTNLIQTKENSLKKSEYDLKKQQVSLEQLKSSIANSTVQSEMDGVVKTINEEVTSDNYYSYSSDDDNSFMTILAIGNYRVKGTVNEQNRGDIVEGTPVIVHSRVNEDDIWSGTMGSLDTENTAKNSNDYYSYYSSSDNSSSNYNFYVDLEDSEGLILGQHVYIEIDNGQYSHTDGLWLYSYYIMRDDAGDAYVWAADSKDRIEKRIVTLGEYDAELSQYEILDGLTAEDYIAFPHASILEGMAAERNIDNATIGTGASNAIAISSDSIVLSDDEEEALYLDDDDISDDEWLDDEEISDDEWLDDEETSDDEWLDDEEISSDEWLDDEEISDDEWLDDAEISEDEWSGEELFEGGGNVE